MTALLIIPVLFPAVCVFLICVDHILTRLEEDYSRPSDGD